MNCHGCLVGKARHGSNLCHECEKDHIARLNEERLQQLEALEAIREDNDQWIERQVQAGRAKKILQPWVSHSPTSEGAETLTASGKP